MKRRKQIVLFLLLITVMGVCSLFGKATDRVFADTATRTQTSATEDTATEAGTGENGAGAEVIEYEGLAEMPGIIKYMIFSLIGVVVLSIIAGIYCAVTPPRRKNKN